MKNLRLNKLGLMLLIMLGTTTAKAADEITDAMTKAYAPYRVALFKTNNGTQQEAENALQQAMKSWMNLDDKYAVKPLPPYDRDAEFKQTLQAVTDVYRNAETQIKQNELAEAHESLEQVRELIAEIRHRNQIITYSDHMNAYHEQMEKLLELNKAGAEQKNYLDKVTLQTGVLVYLSHQLETEAMASLKTDAEFIQLLGKQQKSVSLLQDAVMAHDLQAVNTAIAGLKVPYSKLFVKFG